MDLFFTPVIDLHELCLSILHFTLRCCEHLLKVGAKKRAGIFEYHAKGRFTVNLFQFSISLIIVNLGEEKQAKIRHEMDKIIKNYKEQKNIELFQPRDGGMGSSNTGNTCRDVLSDPEFMSEQTGLSVTLISRFNSIRIALAHTKKKDIDKFWVHFDFLLT